MQQHQGRLFKMFLCHTAGNRIHSPVHRVEGTIVPLICATCFPLLQGSWHGVASLPCNCARYRNPRTILLSGEIFSAMVCSRLLLSYRLKLSEMKNSYIFSATVCFKFKILLIYAYLLMYYLLTVFNFFVI